MDQPQILKSLRIELYKNSDAKIKASGERYFREKVTMYGVKTDVVSRISKDYFKQIKHLSKSEIFDLCTNLWQSGLMEESFIACNWSFNLKKQFEVGDLLIFDSWLNTYVTNWASCDSFCNHTIGEFLQMYPQKLSILKTWATSPNRWVRRGAAVSLIVAARKGKFLKEIFEIADILLLDEDDLVQKGYGWMLKVASQTYQKEVFDYVAKYKATMPRTALRYAIEKMPQNLKKLAMAK